MKDIIRDSTVGQLINGLSGGRYLPYADQRPNYTIPAHFLLSVSTSQTDASIDVRQDVDRAKSGTPAATSPHINGESLTRTNTPVAGESDHIHEKNEVGSEGLAFDPYLVGWNGDDDPENPRCVLHTLFLISPSS
jgi:DHA1 family multidrug resistance protein-like MFS transporter